jgi:hypothetical protein
MRKSYLVIWKFEDGTMQFNEPIDIFLDVATEYTAKELYKKITDALQESQKKRVSCKLVSCKLQITGIYQL